MLKVSVIVPVYNVKDYIERCLDSILMQTFTDFEVICVDDGSTDNSGEICEQYRRKDSRVKVHHTTNKGVSAARNFALSKAEGEWFAFVDADDWVEADYLKILYEKALENDCDIAACFLQKDNTYVLGYSKDDIRTLLFDLPEQCIHNFICSTDSMEGMSVNKLYRARLFRDICFDEDMKVNEDCLYTYEVMKKCQRACLVTVPLYHWFYRADSACHTKKIECDFTPANVVFYLYKETLSLKDEELTKTLQKNYVNAVLKIFLYADYKRTDFTVREARGRCRQWRKDVWKMFDLKTKTKYVLALHLRWMFLFSTNE